MYKKAVKAINDNHVLLVYPIKNTKEPASLWSKLFPRSEMRWDWSDDADNRVVDLWHLKTELHEKQDVVYVKWFRGRATFFSKKMAAAFLNQLHTTQVRNDVLGEFPREIYDQLLHDSPQTPKMLRDAVGLKGSMNAATFDKSLKKLWERMLIVGSGEVDEGNFPSLAMGATKALFEDVWNDAEKMSDETAVNLIKKHLTIASPFVQQLTRLQKKLGISTNFG